MCEAFAEAARRAAGAGFDVLELDMGHGYLLASFLSPESNRREDEYGGDLGGRLRFPLQVLDAVREAWPEDRCSRCGSTSWTARDTGSSCPTASRSRASWPRTAADSSTSWPGRRCPRPRRPIYRRGFLTPLADRVRAEARVPTLVGGYLTTPDEANTILGAGRADLCLLDVPETELERQLAASSEEVAVAV